MFKHFIGPSNCRWRDFNRLGLRPSSRLMIRLGMFSSSASCAAGMTKILTKKTIFLKQEADFINLDSL